MENTSYTPITMQMNIMETASRTDRPKSSVKLYRPKLNDRTPAYSPYDRAGRSSAACYSVRFGSDQSLTDSLAHYGISGQRWHVRRFQNEDGTLTDEGKLRYGIGDGIRSLIANEKAEIHKVALERKAIRESRKEKRERIQKGILIGAASAAAAAALVVHFKHTPLTAVHAKAGLLKAFLQAKKSFWPVDSYAAAIAAQRRRGSS